MTNKKKHSKRKNPKVRQLKNFLQKKPRLLIGAAIVLVVLAGLAYPGRSYFATHFGNKSLTTSGDAISKQTQSKPVKSIKVPSPSQPANTKSSTSTTAKTGTGNTPQASQPTKPDATTVTWTTPKIYLSRDAAGHCNYHFVSQASMNQSGYAGFSIFVIDHRGEWFPLNTSPQDHNFTNPKGSSVQVESYASPTEGDPGQYSRLIFKAYFGDYYNKAKMSDSEMLQFLVPADCAT